MWGFSVWSLLCAAVPGCGTEGTKVEGFRHGSEATKPTGDSTDQYNLRNITHLQRRCHTAHQEETSLLRWRFKMWQLETHTSQLRKGQTTSLREITYTLWLVIFLTSCLLGFLEGIYTLLTWLQELTRYRSRLAEKQLQVKKDVLVIILATLQARDLVVVIIRTIKTQRR